VLTIFRHSGNYGGWKATAIGANYQAAQNLLKENYKVDNIPSLKVANAFCYVLPRARSLTHALCRRRSPWRSRLLERPWTRRLLPLTSVRDDEPLLQCC
jgi:hypothetical protein